jgi:biotin carboxyl carrier protein
MPTYDVTIDGRAAKLSVLQSKNTQQSNLRFETAQSEAGIDSNEINPSGIERSYEVESIRPGVFSILIGGRSYTATLLPNGEVSVNGQVFQVEVTDPRSMKGRAKAGEAQGRQSIAAPMPGRVIRVLVEVGQDVEQGQGLVVVEAMKMQNEMKSPKSGKVVDIKIADGATVTAGQILVVIE